jgi:ribonuclease P protein component
MRVGLIVPRFRHTAVARNQLKRRLRELTRLQLLSAGLPVDIVIRTRPEAYEASFDQLRVDIARTLTQLARSYAS